MKRHIALLVAAVLLLPLAGRVNAAELSASPSRTAFVMDGEAVTLPEAYNIGGYNYLQLRGIAALLSGTAAQFDVRWAETYAVIETGTPYTGAVNPATLADTTDVQSSSTAFRLDGLAAAFENAYLIDSATNYVQLREVARMLSGSASQFDAYYDDETAQAVIVPGEAYTGLAPAKRRTLVTYFGSGIIGDALGTNVETRFAMPGGVCFDGDKLIVFDTFNASVKTVSGGKSANLIETSGVTDDYGFAKPYYLDGKLGDALLGRPTSGAVGANGDLYIADSVNNVVRVVRGGSVYTFAGGERGFADGRRGAAKFDYPTAIAVGKDGELYVTDTNNHCVRKIASDGTVTTVAGVPGKAGFTDGAANAALFREPSGVAVGADGAVYVADTGNHVIRKIADGVVTTVAGAYDESGPDDDYAPGGYADGAALSARFRFPTGLCYADGTLYVADTGNHVIRAVRDGAVTTVAGNGIAGDADGAGAAAMMNKPSGVAYRNGTLYIADTLNNKIKTVAS